MLNLRPTVNVERRVNCRAQDTGVRIEMVAELDLDDQWTIQTDVGRWGRTWTWSRVYCLLGGLMHVGYGLWFVIVVCGSGCGET